MTVLSAQTIMRSGLIVNAQPRTEEDYGGQRYTHGCSPAGYDLRLDRLNKNPMINPSSGRTDSWVLEPGEFVLASAMEEFRMTDDVLGTVHDKSSWARRGLAVQNTVIEPGWEGFLTLELTNHSREPLLLTRGMGICQVIFHRLDEPTFHPYSGKYQNQERGPVEAR